MKGSTGMRAGISQLLVSETSKQASLSINTGSIHDPKGGRYSFTMEFSAD